VATVPYEKRIGHSCSCCNNQLILPSHSTITVADLALCFRFGPMFSFTEFALTFPLMGRSREMGQLLQQLAYSLLVEYYNCSRSGPMFPFTEFALTFSLMGRSREIGLTWDGRRFNRHHKRGSECNTSKIAIELERRPCLTRHTFGQIIVSPLESKSNIVYTEILVCHVYLYLGPRSLQAYNVNISK